VRRTGEDREYGVSEHRWRSFVALGDSFTEGLDDPRPDGSGYRGWADLVAARLAADHRERTHGRPPAEESPAFRYANLAIRGRLFGNVVDEQVPLALAMRPDLISFAAGGNDVLRRSFDGPTLVGQFDQVIGQLRATGADVLIFRFADLTRRLPGARLILPRVDLLNRAVGEVAERHGARLVDLWSDPAFYAPELWSVDRLHLADVGHRRVAAHVLRALGLEPDPAWFTLPVAVTRGWASARADDARWMRQHLTPWIRRRIAGRSSGDAVTAKRPSLSALIDNDHGSRPGS
jgi:lysophospholipase L1-like esterase